MGGVSTYSVRGVIVMISGALFSVGVCYALQGCVLAKGRGWEPSARCK